MNTELYPRFLARHLSDVLSDTPVAVLQGARQVGKSTLAGMTVKPEDAVFVTLDDPLSRDFAEADPVRFLRQAEDTTLVIDEAQRVPSLLLPLKAEVDRDRRPGKFLLTGSADLLRTPGVGDSLAGRAETLHLLPLSQGEIRRNSKPDDFVSTLVRGGQDFKGFQTSPLEAKTVTTGGYPEVLSRVDRRKTSWFLSYAERLATHDAAQISEGKYAANFLDLLRLIAASGLSELVRVKIARSLDVSPTTVSAYMDLLERMNLLVKVPAWSPSPRGRVVRRPKVSLNDTGLSAALASFTPDDAFSVGGREYYGSLVEQFVALELLKQRSWSETRFDLFHYRESSGLEVDFVIKLSGRDLIAVEVKTTMTPTRSHWANLERFRSRFEDWDVRGVLLHGGEQSVQINDWLHVLPTQGLWM